MPSSDRIFERALKLAPAERAAYLRRACAGNAALRSELDSLLDAHASFPGLLALPTARLQPDTTLGPYDILHEHGRGGMGVVYLARDRRDGRPVALKALPAPLRADPRRRAHLRSEARLLASVTHPNVAAIHALERHQGADYLVLEFVPGPTLAERLRRGPLTVDHLLSIARGIALALEAAHGRGVAHLDLKPDNVVLSVDRGVKVLDFGLARLTLPETGRPHRGGTRPGIARGTPGYASPEQLRGRPGDLKCDLFSFGALFYECWTRRPAFPGLTTAERIAATRAAAPDWDLLPVSTPESVRLLLRSCLDRDPRRRPSSASALRRVLDDEIGRRAIPHPRTRGKPPADRTDRARPTNLPVALDTFVGRQGEVRRLRALLARHRLVTVTGPGGGGKSRLAVETSRALLGGPRRSRIRTDDGIWLVELAGAPKVQSALQAIAVALGIREERGRTLRRSLDAALADRHLLIILDNGEHLPPAFARLIDALLDAGQGIRILVTSRSPLGCRHEELLRLEPLPVPPRHAPVAELRKNASARLFLDRARTVEPSFRLAREDRDAVVEICQRLDGLPLALELAAASIAIMPIRKILQQLRATLPVPGEMETAGRHRTLEELVEWSERLLPEAERRLFRRLSVFAGSFTLRAAETVGSGDGVPPWQTFELLSALIRHSLVEAVAASSGSSPARGESEPRYRMLEVVRRYALRRLSRSGESPAVRRRHRDVLLELAREAARHSRGPEQAVWLERLHATQYDFRAALEWSARRDPGGPGLQLAASLGWFWSVRGHWTEGSRLLAEVIAAARSIPSRRVTPEMRRARLHATLWAGNLAFNRGDLAQAVGLYKEVLRGARRHDHLELAGSALLNLGAAAILQGDLDAARGYLEEAIPIQKRLRQPGELAILYLNLGVVAEREQALGRAASLYGKSLALRERIGDPWSVARSLNNVGVVAEKRGRLDEAARLHRRALGIRRRLDDRRGIAETLHNLAAIDARRGRLARAGRGFAEGLEIRASIGDEIGTISGLEAVASTLLQRSPRSSVLLLAHTDAWRTRISFLASPTTQRERERVGRLLTEILPQTLIDEENRRGRDLPVAEAVRLALEVCRAKGAPPAIPRVRSGAPRH